MAATPIVMVWSGGKDSALALATLVADPAWEVTGLLTTVTAEYERISMHGVRDVLLTAQAQSLGLPLHRVWIAPQASNDSYEQAMATACAAILAQGTAHLAFGDLFLQDIRAYREKMLSGSGLTPVFPLWGSNTGKLALRFIDNGFRAILCTIDEKVLSPSFCGRDYDHALLADLPRGIDPCGENGEFHTFVHDGPIFQFPIAIKRGDTVSRDGFSYTDILPG